MPTKTPSRPAVAHHFDDWAQHYESCVLGMWVFLVTEVMFFGGVFAAYMIYRLLSPEAFAHASQRLDIYLGTFNTFILLTSSLTMALAVREAHHRQPRRTAVMLGLTMLLGVIFLSVKFYEYYHKYEEGLAPLFGWPFRYEGPDAGPTQLFFGLYFGMTGIHAVHMIIGIAILAVFLFRAYRVAYDDREAMTVEIVGLYWHFVDLVWIFLFPMLYLIDRSV